MHINDQPIIASAYIDLAGDEKNRCFLSKESIFVRYKNRLESFQLESIKSIGFTKKMFLLPTVIGGIIAPLSILALMRAIGNPWLVLSCLVAGLLLIYYGYEGSPALTITTNVKAFDFFIKRPTPPLKAFIRFSRQLIYFQDKGYFFYIKLTEEELNNWNSLKALKFDKPKPLFYFEEINFRKAVNIFRLDPLAIGANLKFEEEDNILKPYLTGSIKSEDIQALNS